MRERLLKVLVGSMAATALAGCAQVNLPATQATFSGHPKPPGVKIGAVVNVNNDGFGPATVTVRSGQAVEWRWITALPGNVVFKSFSSPAQTKGVYYHVFSKAGVYHYHSAFSAIGHGTVVVR